MGRPTRILLVEDNPGDARLLQELLREARSLDGELHHVDRLSSAQARLAGGEYDVILLDLSLPDAQGMMTVRGALSAAPDVPIVVLTGLNDESVAVQAVQSGAQDYLVKGQVEPALLSRAILYAIERKQLERERLKLLELEQQARSRAEDAVQARDRVLRVVSHDLGNYLSAVKIHALVLQRTLSDPAAMQANLERAEEIGLQVTQMQKLRQDLLDVASIEAGQLSISVGPVDVRELLETAATTVLPLANVRGIRLTVAAAPELPPLLGDRDRLLQTLGNLLGNAIKFTGDGGEVMLRAEPAAGTVRIAVQDTGVGIASENLSRVFDSFWKMREGNPLGAGLGLSIAKGIVEAHGGRIWAKSEPGRGSTFVVDLPGG
jgi:signal transduction histidine kinase